MMKEKLPAAFLSISALCLLLFLIVQCGLYAEQNHILTKEINQLSADLADKEQDFINTTQENTELQAQLSETASLKESETASGFIKKGGVYLIDNEEQLRTLQNLLVEEAEIEPGVSAATASYRLRNDINFDHSDRSYASTPLFYLGTEETPFCGTFDGDGHVIRGYFPLLDASTPAALFHTNDCAQIKNLSVSNDIRSYGLAFAALDQQWKCTELERHLSDTLACSIDVSISAWDLEVQKIAEILHTYWEKIAAAADNADYSVSMVFYPGEEIPDGGEAYIQKLQTALLTLAGPKFSETIEECLTQEEGFLWFLRLERVDDVICCTFEIGEPDYYPNTHDEPPDSYHLITEGTAGNALTRQCFHIPYTDQEMRSIGVSDYYRIEYVDLDFDGKKDLLIHEGFSGGSGGSWSNYRALVQKEPVEGSASFSYFSSFPSQVSSLELDLKRIVNHGRAGAGYEYVIIYEIVDGEYTRTRELIAEAELTGPDDAYTMTLSYYEMGELTEVHILSDWYEKSALYPDMDYWITG